MAETGDKTCPFCLETIKNPIFHLKDFHRITEEKALDKLLKCPDFRELESLPDLNSPSDSRHPRNLVPEKKVTKISDIQSVFGRYICRFCPPPIEPQSVKETVSFPSRSSGIQHVKDFHQEDAVGKTDREIGQTYVVHQTLKLSLVRLDQVP